MRLRPVDLPGDRAGIEDLARRVENATDLGTLSESQALAIGAGTALGLVIEGDDGLTAYSGLVRATERGEWAMEMIVETSNPNAVADLVAHSITAVREVGATAIRWWVYGQEPAHLPAQFGFEPERRLLFMARPIPHEASPDFDSEIEVAAFRPGLDEEAWLKVNNAAFEGHSENGAWTRKELEERMATEWFSAAGFRMAWSGSDLAGFCWTKVHSPEEGEIYVIAIHPSYAGRGLGGQLVLEGMRHLTEVGCERVFLYTEADNDRGIALYRRLGFRTERTHQSFRLTP